MPCAGETLTDTQLDQCGAAELAAIRVGLSIVTSIFVVGAAFFMLAMRTIDKDLAKLNA